MEKYVDIKILPTNSKTLGALSAEMGFEDPSEVTLKELLEWCDEIPKQPRHASLTYLDDRGLSEGEVVLVPYGANFSMLGVVRGPAGGEHPIAGVKYKPVLMTFGVLA